MNLLSDADMRYWQALDARVREREHAFYVEALQRISTGELRLPEDGCQPLA